MTTRLAWLAAALLLIQPAAADAPYFPLTQSFVWDYVGPKGASLHTQVDGTQSVLGEVTTVRRSYAITAEGNDSFENYWTDDGEDVWLNGARSYLGGFTIAYEPPIRWIDAPLFVGKTWSTEVRSYLNDLEGTGTPGEPFTYGLEVVASEVITVPAGTFAAYGIAAVAPTPRSGWDAFGRRTNAGRGEQWVDWYAVGVGSIRHIGSYITPFDLVSYGLPVPIEVVSWSNVKAFFQ